MTTQAIGLIREFLKDRLDVAPERVVPEALLADLGVDSLLLLELMFEFEDRFNIKLPEDTVTPKTVADMLVLTESLIPAVQEQQGQA